jgi:hypothetical protein
MANSTKMNQLSKNFGALKKIVEKNEESRKYIKAQNVKKFEDMMQTVASLATSLTDEMKSLRLEMKADRAGSSVHPIHTADRENPVIIQSGKAKDKGPHQHDYYHVDDEDGELTSMITEMREFNFQKIGLREGNSMKQCIPADSTRKRCRLGCTIRKTIMQEGSY